MTKVRTQTLYATTREESADEVTRGGPRIPKVKGTKTVTATMPNGTVAWLRISPAPASASDINRLRASIGRSSRRQASSFRKTSKAISGLSKRLARDTTRLSKMGVKSHAMLDKRRLSGDTKVAKKLALRTAQKPASLKRQHAREKMSLRSLRRRHIWDQLVLTSSAPLFAAYGQRSRPFAEHNLVLTLSLAVWLFGDEVSDVMSRGRGRRLGQPLDIWSYIAPFGNLATGWWLLSDRQHQRFVTGRSDTFGEVVRVPNQGLGVIGGGEIDVGGEVGVVDVVPSTATYTVTGRFDLEPAIAKGHIDDFRTFSDVRVAATLASGPWLSAYSAAGFEIHGVTASVESGVLILTVSATGPLTVPSNEDDVPPVAFDFGALPQPQVVWMVDTQDPNE